MFYKLIKKTFDSVYNALQFIVIALIIMSFITMIYWCLELGNVAFIQIVAPFFNGMLDIVHSFYTRTILISGQNIDFSFLVAIVIMTLSALGIKSIAEYVKVLEVRFDFIYTEFKKSQEDKFNFALMQKYLAEEFKNNKHAFLINFDLENTLMDEDYDRDFKAGLDNKKTEITKELARNIELQLKCNVRVFGGSIFAYANRFKNIDRSISKLIDCIEKLKAKYSKEHLRIISYVGVDTYASDEVLKIKLENLTRLVKLKFKDEILCLSTFKQRYSLVETPKYDINTQGVYTYRGEREDVFYIKKLK